MLSLVDLANKFARSLSLSLSLSLSYLYMFHRHVQFCTCVRLTSCNVQAGLIMSKPSAYLLYFLPICDDRQINETYKEKNVKCLAGCANYEYRYRPTIKGCDTGPILSTLTGDFLV